MQVITVRMNEKLIRGIEGIAKLRGITRSALIKEILEEALECSSNPIRDAVLALREGKKPSREVDWSRIEEELKRTEPYFPTVEEAIASSRQRRWEDE